jgi:hypothetical protein
MVKAKAKAKAINKWHAEMGESWATEVDLKTLFGVESGSPADQAPDRGEHVNVRFAVISGHFAMSASTRPRGRRSPSNARIAAKSENLDLISNFDGRAVTEAAVPGGVGSRSTVSSSAFRIVGCPSVRRRADGRGGIGRRCGSGSRRFSPLSAGLRRRACLRSGCVWSGCFWN